MFFRTITASFRRLTCVLSSTLSSSARGSGKFVVSWTRDTFQSKERQFGKTASQHHACFAYFSSMCIQLREWCFIAELNTSAVAGSRNRPTGTALTVYVNKRDSVCRTFSCIFPCISMKYFLCAKMLVVIKWKCPLASFWSSICSTCGEIFREENHSIYSDHRNHIHD